MVAKVADPDVISIHAPLSRCDPRLTSLLANLPIFQSTHLFRGATASLSPHSIVMLFQSTHLFRGATYPRYKPVRSIQFQSTHLFRGATQNGCKHPAGSCHFNPRTSFEVRLPNLAANLKKLIFQSTHLFRGATLLGVVAGFTA